MRFDLKKSFGYPVLRKFSEDYINSNISSSIELIVPENLNELCCLEYAVLISVEELKAALQKRDAGLLINISCPKTLFSFSVILYESSGSIQIDTKDLRGDLNINIELVVTSESYNLSSPNIHPEFAGKDFQLCNGDLLAQFMPQKLFIEREVFQPLTSLFQWIPSDAIPVGEWRLDWDDKTIKILINPIQQQKFNMASEGPEGRSILLSAIFLPAVIKLIDAIIRDEVDQDDLWVKVLLTKSIGLGVELNKNTNSLDLAQKLLQFPLSALNKTIFKED